MKPSQVASALKSIANKVDQSTAPNRSLVAADLHKVLASFGRLSTDEPATDAQARQNPSMLLWQAMSELNMTDWTPTSSYDDIEALILQYLKLLGIAPTEPAYKRALAYAKLNFNDYKTKYEGLAEEA